MGRLRQTNMNVPYLPEAGQFRNVVLHNFAVRRVTPPQVALENKLSGRVLSDFLESGPRPFGIDFDVWRYTRKELYALIVGAFERHDLLQILSITQEEFLAFIVDIDRGYFDNPYHSFLHGIDVFQVVYCTLFELGGSKGMTQVELLAILIAALCHDVAHPGVNNLYQVNAGTKLAVMYNDISVLENYSCSQTFAIAAKHGLFRNVSKLVYTTIRSVVIKSILATDMSQHFELQHKFKSFVENHQPGAELDADQRQLILNAVLHMADISNPCRPWDLCRQWSDLVCEEFFLQGDLEKLNKMPAAPNMDRDASNQAQISIGFINFVVLPFLESIVGYLPQCKIFVDVLLKNREQWVLLKDMLERGKNATERVPRPPSHIARHERRISVAPGTITLPPPTVARAEPKAAPTPAATLAPAAAATADRSPQPDPDDADAGFEGVDLGVVEAILSLKLEERPDAISSLRLAILPSHKAQRILSKSLVLLELSNALLTCTTMDSVFGVVEPFFKSVFAATETRMLLLDAQKRLKGRGLSGALSLGRERAPLVALTGDVATVIETACISAGSRVRMPDTDASQNQAQSQAQNQNQPQRAIVPLNYRAPAPPVVSRASAKDVGAVDSAPVRPAVLGLVEIVRPSPAFSQAELALMERAAAAVANAITAVTARTATPSKVGVRVMAPPQGGGRPINTPAFAVATQSPPGGAPAQHKPQGGALAQHKAASTGSLATSTAAPTTPPPSGGLFGRFKSNKSGGSPH